MRNSTNISVLTSPRVRKPRRGGRKVPLIVEDLETRALMTGVIPIGPLPVHVPPPPAPTLTGAAQTTSDSQVNVSWTSSNGAVDYLVVATPVPASAGSVVQETVTANSSSTSYTEPVSGLKPGVTYAFQVEAYNVWGGNWSKTVDTTTLTVCALGHRDGRVRLSDQPVVELGGRLD